MNKKLQAHSAIFFANTIFGLGVPVTKLLLDKWVTPMGYMATRSLRGWTFRLCHLTDADGLGPRFYESHLFLAHCHADTCGCDGLCRTDHR